MASIEAEAYGSSMHIDGGILTVTASNAVGKDALGASAKAIPIGTITRIEMRPAGMLRNGLITIEAGSDTTLVHFRRKHAGAIGQVVDLLRPQPPGLRSTPTIDESPTIAPTSKAGYQVAAHGGRNSDAQWLGPGQTVQFGKRTLPGGMLYIGTSLFAQNGYSTEPALINPRLPVDDKRPDWGARTASYWPSYDSITPQARSAYLQWLAGGRQQPDAPITWAFLFFYGLERRVLIDAAAHPTSEAELGAIRAEVQRLLGIYRGNNSFRRYAGSFLELLNSADGDYEPGNPPNTIVADTWKHFDAVAKAVGYFSKNAIPVPATWALAWIRVNPEILLRTPATRCPQEFGTLFELRYQDAYGDGIIVKPGKRRQHGAVYQAASSGIGFTSTSSELPDVVSQAAARHALEPIVESCTADLDSFSRYLGRNPNTRGTLPAVALLPPELVPPEASGLADLDKFLRDHTSAEPTIVYADDLIALWPTTSGTLAKADAVSLAQLLGTRGVGIEPDVRFGGPVPASGSQVVLFRLERGGPTTPSPEYAAATLLMHLAALVTSADGQVTDDEVEHLRAHVERTLGLNHSENSRIHAHFRWLLTGKLKLTGLTKRLAVLTDDQRSAIGALVVNLAVIDGRVDPGEVSALTGIYKFLGLDPTTVFSSVHAASTTSAPADQPVTVRPSTPGAPGYQVPSPRPEPGVPLKLDEQAIAAKLVETAEVSALLSSIFVDETAASPAPVAAPISDVPLVPGLDAAHSQLLRQLALQDEWSRAELDALCNQLGLLPDGALDTLNEAAYELVGDPVVTDNDLLTINADVAEGMLL
ncbi:MAG: TerB N-terminal domain-containing protein [Actinomycetota bacterium]|nr:TerB N-terminal domain-containing protein [Actinomycetota bacterium]